MAYMTIRILDLYKAVLSHWILTCQQAYTFHFPVTKTINLSSYSLALILSSCFDTIPAQNTFDCHHLGGAIYYVFQ